MVLIMMKHLSNVATLKYNPEKCNGCRTCLDVCPSGVLGFTYKKAYILDRDLCIECGACQNNCEPGAFEVNTGVGCAAAHINSMLTGGEPDCGCNDKNSNSDSCC